MCNAYANRKSAAEVAAIFGVDPPDIASFNVQEEVWPGWPGMVVREEDGRRRLQSMVWGFPLARKSKRTGLPIKPKTVNNVRADRLFTPFWRTSFETRRCLIPLTEWAEADGEKGRMTRTWFSVPETEQFAAAGIWRRSDEWGDVYSMVTVDASAIMADLNDRMPAILRPEDWDRWMNAVPDDALSLARSWNELAVFRSGDPWYQPVPAAKQAEPRPDQPLLI
jgi:putative SOS response-associated peptidase YedK